MSVYQANPEHATGRADLVVKLLARALDPAAHEGEALNAAEKMVRISRREQVTLPDLAGVLAVRRPAPPQPPLVADRVMPFGKYAGETLGDVARRDPSYLRWFVQNIENDSDLVEDAAMVLDWYQHMKGAEQ